ncbi:MFS transporter [Glacieibacterium frigidum]|uniref:MFS transporter n=1 Tax=Glacieibacterium frigidum TaxID=2593303 RepID=A0A552U8C1_9SPHN|nr:MFS transporter [Glacieibacterium frigidum]TRW14463.1 MFS transporter [Glacieibacterium frigidum]
MIAHAACDRTAAEAISTGGGTARPRLVLAATILGSSLAFIDGSVVNVALPAIGRELGGEAAELQWVVNAYLLPLSALLLLGGALGDRYGRRRLFLLGIALFTLASVLCAAAPGLTALLAGRALQGVGAALLMPNSLAILGSAFSDEERGKAIGTWAAAGAAAGALGPLLGGWLIDDIGWRAIFLINLPIATAAAWLGWHYVVERSDAGRSALDWRGAALATAGLGALTWGLTTGSGPGGFAPAAALPTLAGAALLALFVWAEGARGERAMVPLTLFGSASFVGLTLLTFLLYGALGGLLVLLPYLLIEAAGYSALEAGAALLPFAVVLSLSSRFMGRLAARVGPRLPLSIGPLVVASGFLLATRIGTNASYWTEVLPAVMVIAIGMAGAVAPLTTAVLGSIDARFAGTASGFNSAVARTGGLIATALLGTALAIRGEALAETFERAVLAGAGLAAAAGLSAAMLLAQTKR